MFGNFIKGKVVKKIGHQIASKTSKPVLPVLKEIGKKLSKKHKIIKTPKY